eukprot:g1870.t1
MKNCLLLPFLFYFAGLAFADSDSLRDAAEHVRAKRSPFFVGAAVNAGHISAGNKDTNYSSTLSAQYSLVTPENACKWGPLRPTPTTFNFKGCDADINFSSSAKQIFRFHNLCWGNQNPDWLLNGHFNSTELQGFLTNHITTVVSHYRKFGNVYAYDVVNEAVNDSPFSSNNPMKNLKPNVWFPTLSNYIEIAFQTARATDPTVKLFYNDYSIHTINTKSNKTLALLKYLVEEKKVPIDGIGFQFHLQCYSSSSTLSVESITSNFARFSNLGLEIHITELDVAIAGSCTEDHQAAIYANVTKACLFEKNCRNLETWGFNDKYSWKGASAKALPFDENYQPKPAYFAIKKALENF